MYSITLALNPVPSMVICGAQKREFKTEFNKLGDTVGHLLYPV